MQIPVIFWNMTFDMVSRAMLNMLLASRVLVGFMRSSGWVIIGRDPIRAKQDPLYTGKERRQG